MEGGSALVAAVVLALVGGCRAKEPAGKDEPRAADAAVMRGADASVVAAAATASSSWRDRCLGPPAPIHHTRAQTRTAVAAAALVLDGDAAPQKPQFDSDFTLALTTLAIGRDGTDALARALASATAIADDATRERALLWGAIALSERGDAEVAAQWAAALRDDDHRRELAAHQVRLLAERGDLAGARSALEDLPAIWDRRVDVQSWPGYPRWLGSAAAIACVALGSSRVVVAPEVRGLLEQAEQMTVAIDEPWRQDLELRTLALAWVRAGSIDRGLRAASRIAGASRAAALFEVLEVAGEPWNPQRSHLDPGLGDKIARGIQIKAVCEQLARREITLMQALAPVPEYDVAVWIRTATDVDCPLFGKGLMQTARFAGRLAGSELDHLRYLGRLDDAIALLQWAWDRMTPAERGDQLAALVASLSEAGRARDAAALLRSMPAHVEPQPELHVLTAGYWLVVALATTGDSEDAEALRNDLTPRLARALGE